MNTYITDSMTANEDIMGFYSSGPKIKENDLKVRI